MTDEEVLSLLADSKISVKSRKWKRKVYAGTTCGGCHCKVCRKLGIYLSHLPGDLCFGWS